MSGDRTGPAFAPDVERQSTSVYPGWGVLALTMLLCTFAAGPVYYAYGNYAVSFAAEFGASRTVINLGYTVVLLVGNVGSAPVGWLLDRWPVRRVALVGAIGTGLGLGLVSVTTAMWQVLLLFTTLIAFADVFLGVVIVNYLLSHWFERRRGLVLSLAQVGSSAGAIIFPPLTALLTTDLGWRPVFVIYGLVTALLAVPILIFARLPGQIPAIEAVARVAGAVQGPKYDYGTIWRNSPFWIITATTGTMIGLNGATMVSLVPFASAIGIGVQSGALLVSIVGGAAFVGKIGFSLFADRIDLKLAVRGALLLFVVSQALFATSRSLPLLQLAAALTGLGLGGMLPVWGLVTARVFGLASYGTALGATRTAMTPIAFICPMLTGVLFDRYGSYTPAWATLMAIALLAFAITFLSRDWALPIAEKIKPGVPEPAAATPETAPPV